MEESRAYVPFIFEPPGPVTVMQNDALQYTLMAAHDEIDYETTKTQMARYALSGSGFPRRRDSSLVLWAFLDISSQSLLELKEKRGMRDKELMYSSQIAQAWQPKATTAQKGKASCGGSSAWPVEPESSRGNVLFLRGNKGLTSSASNWSRNTPEELASCVLVVADYTVLALTSCCPRYLFCVALFRNSLIGPFDNYTVQASSFDAVLQHS
ncbi:uncharacterized protein BKA78DRAFT_294273 [Phyllosticta capitalensis]|uniref:Uncharacterized protein n=1 Tax=Phyllosticta capitalensis TaxID=121624 RepID=A0ABR1YVU8_9PEZI